MFRFITRQVLTGLVTILPVMLTLYLLYWFIISTEKMLGELIKLVMPDAPYWPGMGFIVGLLLVFAIGLLMQVYVIKKLFNKAEEVLYHMPLIKSVYGAIRDFFHYFSPSRQKDFQQVVAVTLDNGIEVIGFLTQESSQVLPTAAGDEERVLVYVPMSYTIGGYAIMIPRSSLRNVDMSMEQAMRFVLTAGVASNSNDDF